MNFKVEKILERDIDFLIINNFINGNLINLFLEKSKLSGYQIVHIEHSLMDNDLGESDITVIVEKGNHRIGLLIEDKIDAIAMDMQPDRYIKRGEKGIKNGDYGEFKVFIIAPQKYLDTNIYAKQYEYQISYEEIKEVLSNDLYSVTLLNKAIEEKEKGYTVIENENVTRFWERYYRFLKEYYPEIKIYEIHGPRGSKAVWPELLTDYSQVKIIHKSNNGQMDLTFNGMGSYIEIFNKYVNNLESDFKIVNTGKSLAIRLDVPVLDFKQDFDLYIDEMHKSMQEALRLYKLLSSINVLMMYNEIKNN